MTISELEKKSKNKTLSKGERVLLETKKELKRRKRKVLFILKDLQ